MLNNSQYNTLELKSGSTKHAQSCLYQIRPDLVMNWYVDDALATSDKLGIFDHVRLPFTLYSTARPGNSVLTSNLSELFLQWPNSLL